MKFKVVATDDKGQVGVLTLVRKGNVMEYWSFELVNQGDANGLRPTNPNSSRDAN